MVITILVCNTFIGIRNFSPHDFVVESKVLYGILKGIR